MLSASTGLGRWCSDVPEIRFGKWTPDLPPPDAELVVCKNVISVDGTYRQAKAMQGRGSAIPGAVRGAFRALDGRGNAFIYAGTLDTLYWGTSSQWNSAAGFSLLDGHYWRFCQYDKTVLATNYTNQIQAAFIGGGFEAVPSAPRARTLGVIRDFAVAGDIASFDYEPNAIQWSAIGDPRDWPIPLTDDARSKQSGKQSLPSEYGQVTFIANGERFGLIFQEHGISRASYVGGDVVFQFDSFEKSKGCITPNGAIQVDDLTYFVSGEGFHVTDGQQVKDIGAGVDKFFWSRVNNQGDYIDRISVSHDPMKKLLLWAYPAHSSTTPNEILVFNYQDGRWSLIETPCDLLFPTITTGVSLDDLDEFFDSLDDVTPGLDSRFWQGGDIVSGGFSEGRLATFTGAPLTATLETGEANFGTGGRAFLTGVHPVAEGGSQVLSILHRDSLLLPIKESQPMTAGRSGWIYCRVNAKYHRFKLRISGGFEYVQGLLYEAIGAGR
jgi:hypothetical protein